MKTYECTSCKEQKTIDDYDLAEVSGFRIFSICKDCSDKYLIENVNVTCSAGCGRKLPSSYYGHYRTRLKPSGYRLRVNTNCKDCSKKESKILSKIKKENPPPKYLTECPQCSRTVYEKSEDIPEKVNGTNGPWQCDHDHETGLFRAYLCKQCNTGRGLVGDTKDSWEIAVKTKTTHKMKKIKKNKGKV